MTRILPPLAGLVAILLTGLAHGLWTDRWQLSDEPSASAAKLANVAMSLGDWDSQKVELDTQSLAIGEIAGYLDRKFANQRTGAEVSTLVVCGRPGPISQHPPEVCYGGEGFNLQEKVRRTFAIDGIAGPAEFLVGRFHRTEAGMPVYLRIFWSWSPDGSWLAPDKPRVRFAGYPDLSHLKIGPRYPALYKLYIVRRMAGPEETIEEDPALDFMKLLLPELQRALFQAADSNAR